MEDISFIQQYMDKMREIQRLIIEFIENDEISNENFNDLIDYFNKQNIKDNKHELKSLLHLISKIADNHQRAHDFFSKIEQIIKLFHKEINKYFSNFCVFNIFKNNKRILLFLLREKIIIPEKSIFLIISNDKYKERFYPQYFYPEFKYYFDRNLAEEVKSEISKIDPIVYNQMRENGENDSYICQLIQKDLVEEFVTYVNQTNLSLSDTIIKPSIFETNLFLFKNKEVSLIEYAAFFGSIQIFQFLRLSNVKLTPSLWLYTIHSKNADLVHLLENNELKPKDESFIDCYLESAKCHHNDFMNYILENYYKLESNEKILGFPLFYNFGSTTDEFTEVDVNSFCGFCKNDYFTIVEFILKNKLVDLSSKTVFNNYFFFE
ncbi:hypothetical protein M9Y10_042626 [Tritrichomonas musculus]|uniref:DUF3447 domain-containing protein n=1 Tax=Tritrichomonas musculus TaxID=1915356 RepID=A0ABR2JZ54_9EUKA